MLETERFGLLIMSLGFLKIRVICLMNYLDENKLKFSVLFIFFFCERKKGIYENQFTSISEIQKLTVMG